MTLLDATDVAHRPSSALDRRLELGPRHRVELARRQLDRERHAVETVEDAFDRHPVGRIDLDRPTHCRARPFVEQRSRVSVGQRAQRIPVLALDPQGHAARREHLQLGAARHEHVGQPSRVDGNVLAVVQDDERARRTEVGDDRLEEVLPRTVVDRHLIGQRLHHRRRRLVGQRHEDHVRARRTSGVRDGDGEPGLAGPAGADDRHEASPGEEVVQGDQLRRPADQRRQRHR